MVTWLFSKKSTSANACSNCLEQEELLRELSALSTKITVEVYDFVLNGDEVMNYKVDKIPATAVVGKRDFGIRFYGLTVGYEFTSLLQDIVMVSTERTGLDPRLEILVKTIAASVHLQIMVTLTCPHCQKWFKLHISLRF
jgi:alkyl hydroperoxide reductase subunit AhpF